MKVKRNRNVKKIIIFAMILFEFSIVFLFTNVNFENSFVTSDSSLEEETVGDEFQSDKIIPETTGTVNTTILRPNEDILTEWVFNTQPHWSSIDEEIPDSKRVGWVDGEENTLEIFGFESTYFENVIVTAVEIYAYGHRYYSGPASASIFLGEWTQNLDLNLPVQGEYWSSCRWNNLEGSYEDLQNLQVKIAASTWCSANGYGYINTLYVVVTTDKPPLWRYQLSGAGAFSSPALGDIDDDGILEVVIGSDAGTVYSFDSQNGNLEWSYQTGDTVYSSPSLGDIDKDGFLEVIIGSYDGKVYAFNGQDGSLVWSYSTGGSVRASPTLGDIDNDRELDVIIGSSNGYLYALNGENGSVKWSFQTGGGIPSSAALADVDNDMKLEVIVGSDDDNVYAINGEDGTELWSYTTGEDVFSSPTVGDIDLDGELEVVIGSFDYFIYSLKGKDGTLEWQFQTEGYAYSSPALGDINNDGTVEVVTGSIDGKIYALYGKNGSLIWDYQTGNQVHSSPSLGDIDGDNKPEVIVGSLDGMLYGFNGEDGSVEWSYKTGGQIYSTPILGDVNGDKKLEVIIGSYDSLNNDGEAFVLEITPSGKEILWQGLSGDSSFHRTKLLGCDKVIVDQYSIANTSLSRMPLNETLIPNSFYEHEVITEDDFLYTGEYRNTKGDLLSLTAGQNKQLKFEIDATYNWIPLDRLEAVAWASVKTPSIIDINNLANIKIHYDFDRYGEVLDNNIMSDFDGDVSFATASLFLLKNTGTIVNFREELFGTYTYSYLIKSSRFPFYSIGESEYPLRFWGGGDDTIDLLSKGLDLGEFIFPDGSLKFILYGESFGKLTHPSFANMRVYQELELKRLDLEIVEKTAISTQINFSIRKYHSLTEDSKLVLSLSNYVNSYDGNYFEIRNSEGNLYESIPLPFSENPTDIEINVPIKLDRLSLKSYADGKTYLDNLTYELLNPIIFDISSYELFLEDKFSQEGNLRYTKEQGFIDFGLEACPYRGTAWRASRVDIHMPEYPELRNYYGIQDDVFLDQFWSINRIEFPYIDDSYELDLPYGFYTNHILYINDTDLTNDGKLNESLNPFTYRVTFDKKPLAMSLYIQKPDLTLGDELVVVNPTDYSDNSLYCNVYDPNPLYGLARTPYFMNFSKYSPLVHYLIDGSISTEGSFSIEGVNTEVFIWILEAGLYDFTSNLENIIEPFYNTLLENSTQFKVVQQPYFDISYNSNTIYMGESLEFAINLTSPNGLEIGQNITIFAENSSWDGLDRSIMNLGVLANYSGNIYHFEEGFPSLSPYLANGKLAYTLLNGSLPSNGLIFAPEILEYNPMTKYSKQQLEFYIVLDLSELIENHNLNPREDFSFLEATIFGSSFIDSLQDIEDIKDYFGKLEIYNSHLDSYEALKDDNIFTETLDNTDPNNLLRLEDISNYQFKKDYQDEIWRYIDSQNRITFRLVSYFEGNVSDPNTYLSSFDKQNAVLGALVDFVEFDIVWWKNSPELVDYVQAKSRRSPTTFSYTPTAPGTYNITFEYYNSSSFYHFTQEIIEITVERRPVNINLEVISDGYSTGVTTLQAAVTDRRSSAPAIDARVKFFSLNNGEVVVIGEGLTNTEGIASLSTSNLALGDHMIWAETIPNTGKHLRPFIDDYYDVDKWALNSSVLLPLHISLSQSYLELISLAPEGTSLIVNQRFYVYPKLVDLYTGKEIYNEPIEIFINSEEYGIFYSSVPILLSFIEPGIFVVEAFYGGTPVLSESYASTTFTVQRLSLYFSETPQDILYPNQLIYITVTAFDLATETLVSDLPVSLHNNLTPSVVLGNTNTDGTVTFAFQVPENWAGSDVHFFAFNSEISGKYLERRTDNFSTNVRPYNCSAFLTLHETKLFVNHSSYYTFELWNEDLKKYVNDESLLIDVLKDKVLISSYAVLTDFNNTLDLKFLVIGEYELVLQHNQTDLYMYCINTFNIEILRRPTYITVEITDQDLVPGNEFSVSAYLNDALTNESILYKFLNVTEYIYSEGLLVEERIPFPIYIPITNTFHWQPLREADFEFVFTFELNDPIYQNSNYSIILSVEKRQVHITSEINSFTFKVGEYVQISSLFTDLNTTNWDPIENLVVHYLIQYNNTILFSQNFTSNTQGLINFDWQIPLNLVNTTFNITLFSANTNYYMWNYELFEISTVALDTYFNVTSSPNPTNYINEETVFIIELLSILGESLKVDVNYEIYCPQISYYYSGVINLEDTSSLSIVLSEEGRYEVIFFYNGSEFYVPSQFSLIYYINLRPVSLELVESPEFLYYTQQTASLTYRLTDAFTNSPIANCLILLFYIDFDTTSKIYLDLQQFTDLNGEVTFLVDLPIDYDYDSFIFLAESDATMINNAGMNSVKLLISDSPTYINLNSETDSLLLYVGDSLNITFELFDYYDELLLSELLSVEIETPYNMISTTLKCNKSIELVFSDVGVYKINVLYPGNVSLLPSSAQIYYYISLIPTTLEYTEIIPDTVFADQNIFISTQLKNNLTKSPLGGETVKFYMTNGLITSLLYEGMTDGSGILSYVWDIDPLYLDQNVQIYAICNFTHTYQNCSSPVIQTYISRYNVDLEIIEFPEILVPLTETSFTFTTSKQETGEIAAGCNLQLFLIFPNDSRILLYNGLTNEEGILSYDWTPHRHIFNFSELRFEVILVDDNYYFGCILLSSQLLIDKIPTTLSVIPSKYFVLPYENIPIEFDLVNIYGESLVGHTLNVEIINILFSINFTVIIGLNDTYNFIIPNYGAFEIIGVFEGSDRNHPSINTTLIYSEKFDLLIELSIFEAFTKDRTISFLGEQWDYSIFENTQNFTLVANVSIIEYNIPMENIEVMFYFIVKNQDPILIGSNFTNREGIAILRWDTTNYSISKNGNPRALLAKVDETNYNHAAESNPIYFTLRKIHTFIAIDTFTSSFRIDVNYAINITLFDELSIKLDGYNVSAEIYFRGKIVQSHYFLTNKTTQIYFTPTQCGSYTIKVSFSGTEVYKASHITESYNCVEKEPTALRISLPENILPDKSYDIKIILTNSTGGILIGERVDVRLTYHDESGATEIVDVYVIIGDNNTFNWIFPDFDEYVIKATYLGSDDYIGCKDVKHAKNANIWNFSFWELFFIVLTPCLIIFPSREKTGKRKSKWKKRKKIFAVLGISFAMLGANYANIAYICSQIETTGIIKDFRVESNFNGENLSNLQTQDTMIDMFDYGSSMLRNVPLGAIPNLENTTSPYDLIVPDSTIIPPEADFTPPNLRFIEVSDGHTLTEIAQIMVSAYDRETGIQKVVFHLLYQGVDVVAEGEFTYNESSGLYNYSLNTLNFEDGNYDIHATAFDHNNNDNTIVVSVDISNNPTYEFDDIELDYAIVELTDYLNVSYTSLRDGSYTIQIVNKEHKTILSFSGPIMENEEKILEIPIDPLYFKVAQYKIIITVSVNVLGFSKKETKDFDLEVVKEGIALGLDVEEGEDIYTDHLINFRARLVENDLVSSGSIETGIPISGQVLTFKIGDSDNHQILGTAITDINGYATFTYRVELAKGLHIFNVSYAGNNVHKSFETYSLFENQGVFTQILLSSEISPVSYNNIGELKAKLITDDSYLANKSLYFSLSNPLESIYLGMAQTDVSGEATIRFPCNQLPGNYNVIITFDGDGIYSENTFEFLNAFEILKESTEIKIVNAETDIICPFNTETEIAAKLVINETHIGIEGVPLTFEVIYDNNHLVIGNSTTDSNGLASILFRPSDFSLTPRDDDYILNIYINGDDYYDEISSHITLHVKKDVPIITIEGTEAYFLESFQINASLTSSLLTPLSGKPLQFYIINSTTGDSIYDGTAFTNDHGLATLNVPANKINKSGVFNIAVQFSGDEIEDYMYKEIHHALTIHLRETHLYIQGAKEQIPTEYLEIKLILTDNKGAPIEGQKIYLECYKENSNINLLGSETYVLTNASGIVIYTLPLLLQGKYKIYAYYNPQSDDLIKNNGFLDSEAIFKFKIVSIPADLSLRDLSLPRIMRGDVLDITIVSGSKEAKDYIIPVRIYLDAENFEYVDILGMMFLYYGVSRFSYKIPFSSDFQAGIYNFTIEIQPGSLFEGSMTFSIDLVERTTLLIEYFILNPLAEGKHYIREQENITFTLIDEDNMPLPYTCENEFVNRWIHYQIINGKNLFGSEEVGLLNGSFFIIHKPESYGFETSSAINTGSRFFAPSREKKRVEVFRRPLILHFVDYSHDNQDRLGLPYSGHRGEHLLVTARVQDYLSRTYLKNHKVIFGYNKKYSLYSSSSDMNGNVLVTVPLDSESGLIQAGKYRMYIKIDLSEKFGSVVASSPNLLHILEFGHFECNVGPITTRDMNYVIRPTITFYDEDNKPVSNFPFYMRFLNKDTNEVYVQKFINNGVREIAITEGGKFVILITITPNEIGSSTSEDLIATYMVLQTLIIALKKESIEIEIWSPLIPAIYIPFFSDMILPALWQSIKWKASPYTILIWFILFVLFGKEKIDLTWGKLFTFMILIIVLKLTEMADIFWELFLKLGILATMHFVSEVFSGANWLLNSIFLVIQIAISLGITYALHQIENKLSRLWVDLGKIIKESKENKKNIPEATIILIELLLTASWGLYVLAYRALGELVKPFSWVLKWMWARKKDWESDIKDSHTVYLTMIYLLIRYVVGVVVDAIIPKTTGFFAFLTEILRNVLKISITIILTAAAALYSLPISTIVDSVILIFIKFFIKEIFGIGLSLVIESLSVPYAGDDE